MARASDCVFVAEAFDGDRDFGCGAELFDELGSGVPLARDGCEAIPTGGYRGVTGESDGGGMLGADVGVAFPSDYHQVKIGLRCIRSFLFA